MPLLALLLVLRCAEDVSKVEVAISEVLDSFHLAAAKADENAYFGCLADQAVFLGTDAKERWTKDEFRKYCKPYFEKGIGWKYIATQRHVTVGPDGKIAWFDELLENQKNGQCRGSGVLVKNHERWKIAQYNLSIPIPNEAWPKIKPLVDAARKGEE